MHNPTTTNNATTTTNTSISTTKEKKMDKIKLEKAEQILTQLKKDSPPGFEQQIDLLIGYEKETNNRLVLVVYKLQNVGGKVDNFYVFNEKLQNWENYSLTNATDFYSRDMSNEKKLQIKDWKVLIKEDMIIELTP